MSKHGKGCIRSIAHAVGTVTEPPVGLLTDAPPVVVEEEEPVVGTVSHHGQYRRKVDVEDNILLPRESVTSNSWLVYRISAGFLT